TTLRTTDAQGSELSSSVVTSPEGAQAQAQVDRAQFPDATAQTVMPTEEAAARRGAESAPSTKSGLRQFGEGMLDVAAAPRSIMTSADLSAAGRQGLIFTLTEPLSAVRAMKRQVASLVSAKRHNDLFDWLESHPDAQLAKDSGLYLAIPESAKGGHAGREEAFYSRLASNAPVVKQSERAYTAYLDSLRMDVFSKYARELRSSGLTPEQNSAGFQAIARFVNAATGRGSMPEALQKLAPVLNTVGFAPRNLAGRWQVLNPVEYMRMPAAARKIAMRKMVEFTGTVVAGMTLAHLAGAKTTIDPRDPDFGKVVVGHTHYDLTGGHRSVVRFVLQMSKAFAALAEGERPARNQDVLSLTTRYLRENAAPVPAYLIDAKTGKSITGQDFKVGRDTLRLVTPLFAHDLYEGWKDSGGRGAAMALPGGLGIGVQTYAPKGRQRSATDAQSDSAVDPQLAATVRSRLEAEAARNVAQGQRVTAIKISEPQARAWAARERASWPDFSRALMANGVQIN
ncbi:MAG: hypothetical protein ACJ74W_01260, partial [Pyrinomonadaceae bacterium]